jgi:endonuclease/exonuclease/phosphatase family metal-dependent hydrolase
LDAGIENRGAATIKPLRVMTYNIFKGAVGKEKALARVVESVAPDVLFLQEVGSEASIQTLAQRFEYRYCFAGSFYGPKNLALLSRYPLVATETHTIFPLFHPLILATISLPSGAQVNLYGVHIGVLYDWWRTVEMRTILRLIQQWEHHYPAPYALIAGDFNAILPGDTLNLRIGTRLHRVILFLQYRFATRLAPRLLARQGWIDGYRHCHPTADGFSFPVTAPAVRLDHIYVNSSFAPRLCRCEVVTSPPETHTVSDHFPLMADFDLA